MSTYHTFGATTYNLGSSISSTATTILLSSFLEPVTGTPYTMVLLNTDIAYGTIAPKTTSSEFISFTGITQNANGTATLTGVTRGLAKKYPFTSNVAYKLPHSGQTQFIISDAPQVFEKYPAKENDEVITGLWTFNQFPITPSNTPATTSTIGLVKVSVAPVSALSPIAVETTDPRMPVAYAVDSVGTDAYAITPSPAITAYAAGQVFSFKAGTANTGAATLNVNGLGAKAIVKNANAALETGDILVNQIVVVEYDGTNMQMVSQESGLKDASKILTGTLGTLNGGTGVATSVSYNSGTIVRDLSTASGAVTTAHGLGVIPKRIKITSLNAFSSTTATISCTSTGTYDGTTNRTIYVITGVGFAGLTGNSSSVIVHCANSNNGADFQEAVATFDSTNITLTWTRTGTPTTNAQLLWEAFAF